MVHAVQNLLSHAQFEIEALNIVRRAKKLARWQAAGYQALHFDEARKFLPIYYLYLTSVPLPSGDG